MIQGQYDRPTAFVTGAGSGIGEAISMKLAAEGFAVAAIGRRQAEIARTARRVGGVAIPADVTREADVEAAISGCLAAFGRLDLLVNNAGQSGGVFETADEVDIARWDAIFAVNVRGAMLCIKHALPHLQVAEGTIVNVSSVAAIRPAARHIAYGASKAALLNLTKSIAAEVGAWGVRVNAVCPGTVDTPLYREIASRRILEEGGSIEEDQGRRSALTALKRLTTAEEVASAVHFLATAASGTMTGTAVVIDSGRVFAP